MAKIAGVGSAVLKWPEDRTEDWGLTVWHLADSESQGVSPSDSSSDQDGQSRPFSD
jgi:hypothetical protein